MSEAAGTTSKSKSTTAPTSTSKPKAGTTKTASAPKPASSTKTASAPNVEKEATAPKATEAPTTDAPQQASPEAPTGQKNEGLKSLFDIFTSNGAGRELPPFLSILEEMIQPKDKTQKTEDSAPTTESPAQAAPKAGEPEFLLVPLEELLATFPEFLSAGEFDGLDLGFDNESDGCATSFARGYGMASHPSNGANFLPLPFGMDAFGEIEQLPTIETIVERDEVSRSYGHLVDLKKLLDAGVLTEAEYAAKKTDILRTIY